MRTILFLNYLAALKFITLILALYVITCSAIPCCAMDSCSQEQSGKRAGDDCKGNCSPFFACGSCAGFSHEVQQVKLKPVLVKEPISYSDFYLCSHSDYFHSFWQPPKLV